MTIRVAVFNDSPTIRTAIRAALEEGNEMRVILERPNGVDAGRFVADHHPDVVLMDIVMPLVDGWEATRDIMARQPTPVIMLSAALDTRDDEVVLRSLQAGALHLTDSPPSPDSDDWQLESAKFAELVRVLAGARQRTAIRTPSQGAPRTALNTPVQVLGIVSSAGGPPALSEMLRTVPPQVLPPTLVVQHIAHGFIRGFAAWVHSETGHRTRVATDGEPARRGTIYFAPDDHHLAFRGGSISVFEGAPRNRFCPSGDVLFESLAPLGSGAVAVVLSGMGSDGAAGAALVKQRGGSVGIEDPSLAAVSGMPESARKATVDVCSSPAELGHWLVELCTPVEENPP